MQLTIQTISGVLTIAVVALTVLGVLKSRKTQKIETPRAEPTISTEPLLPKPEMIVEELEEEDNDDDDSTLVYKVEEEIPEIPQVISVTLLADKTHPYSGHELLHALLSHGFRYGKMNIFHFYKESNGQGPLLFSCASAKKPGTFDIKNMGPFATPGLTFFIQLSHEIENATALDAMLSTADLIIHDLGGHLLDEQHKILSDDKISQWRKQIRLFEKTSDEIAA